MRMQAMNPAGGIYQAIRSIAPSELVTIAWCKFFEVLIAFPQLVKPVWAVSSLRCPLI